MLTEYLVEMYLPAGNGGAGNDLDGRAEAAALEVTDDARPIRFVRSIVLPSDESCLLLFAAADSDLVAQALGRAGLHPDRIVATG